MTDTLWHIPPAEPGPLPFKWTDAEGSVWTDLAKSAEGRAACGFVEGPAKPGYDPTSELLEWVDGAWTVSSTAVTEVSMLQLELELASRNLTADVAGAVEALGAVAGIYWRRGTAVHRTHPMLLQIQAHLNWSDQLVDQIAAGAAVRS